MGRVKETCSHNESAVDQGEEPYHGTNVADDKNDGLIDGMVLWDASSGMALKKK